MPEAEAVRERELEPPIHYYEQTLKNFADIRERLTTGKIVLRGRDAHVEKSRQGHLHFILRPEDFEQGKACLPNWLMFVHEIHTTPDGITTSGQHRHQGGLGLFAIEGEGYTVVDGVRHDWKAGDFIMLPIKPNGCVHQHFSRNPGAAAKWLAIIFMPYNLLTGMAMEQRKVGSLVHS